MATSSSRMKRAKTVLIGDEPSISATDYKVSLINVFNWHNINSSDKDRRLWVHNYMKSMSMDFKILSKATDFELRQVAVLCRLKLTEQTVALKDEQRISVFLDELKTRVVVAEVKEIITKPVVTIQDRISEVTKTHIGEIEAELDNFISTKTTSFSTKSYLLSNTVSGVVTKKIAEYFAKTLAELKLLVSGKDAQLVEGYSHLKKVEQKRFVAFVESIIADCQQQVVVAKVARKPRTKKPTAPGKVVSKLKYMPKFDELGLQSINPTTLVDSTMVLLYNTKLRKLNVYYAVDGESMTIKGTTLLNFDTQKSKEINVRKPEEFFKGINLGKRAINNTLKTLKATSKVMSGRISDDFVILGAFN